MDNDKNNEIKEDKDQKSKNSSVIWNYIRPRTSKTSIDADISGPFRGKSYGCIAVLKDRGNDVCESAIARLRERTAFIKQHKRKVEIEVNKSEISVIELGIEESLHTHQLLNITFVWRDTQDLYSFGIITSTQDKAQPEQSILKFYAYKLEKKAQRFIDALKLIYTELRNDIAASRLKNDDKEQIDSNESKEEPGNIVIDDLLKIEDDFGGNAKSAHKRTFDPFDELFSSSTTEPVNQDNNIQHTTALNEIDDPFIIHEKEEKETKISVGISPSFSQTFQDTKSFDTVDDIFNSDTVRPPQVVPFPLLPPPPSTNHSLSSSYNRTGINSQKHLRSNEGLIKSNDVATDAFNQTLTASTKNVDLLSGWNNLNSVTEQPVSTQSISSIPISSSTSFNPFLSQPWEASQNMFPHSTEDSLWGVDTNSRSVLPTSSSNSFAPSHPTSLLPYSVSTPLFPTHDINQPSAIPNVGRIDLTTTPVNCWKMPGNQLHGIEKELNAQQTTQVAEGSNPFGTSKAKGNVTDAFSDILENFKRSSLSTPAFPASPSMTLDGLGSNLPGKSVLGFELVKANDGKVGQHAPFV